MAGAPNPEFAELRAAFSDPLRSHGFRVRGSTWALPGEEVTPLANIQRSAWSPSFHVNLGFFVESVDRVLAPSSRRQVVPSVTRCSVQVRATAVFCSADDLDRIAALGGQRTIEHAERIRLAREVAAELVVPLLRSGADLGKLIDLIRNGEWAHRALIHVRAHELLGVEKP